MQRSRQGILEAGNFIVDHAFTDQMKAAGAKTDWFGTHGDVFPVGVKVTPFPPLSPDGTRSFPRRHLAKGHGEWNHYYIRAINGGCYLRGCYLRGWGLNGVRV